MVSIEHINTCESTQDEVAKRVKSQQVPFWVSASLQSKGRGSRGKSWESTGGGVYVSGVLPSLGGYIPGHTSLVGALLAKFLMDKLQQNQTKQNKPKIWLKWPNDILLEQNGAFSKVAGVLCESSTIDKKTFITVGIGVNAAQQGFALEQEGLSLNLPAASLGENPDKFDVPAFASSLATYLQSYWVGTLEAALQKSWQQVDPVPYWVKGTETLQHQSVLADGFLQLSGLSDSQMQTTWTERKQGWVPSIIPG